MAIININRQADCEVVIHDAYGSFYSSKGNHKVSIFGCNIYSTNWDTKYADATKNSKRPIGLNNKD